ncbi:hypothetical protein [Glycomyces buryatensis]|uniref:SMI1/KNR4 family protein n=1 Tax=Glycomyces buryatensis TaxID=2570927 RepID=A0A4S8Q146_9ACTN|nr:hypothetical protein [Glycomyces buryatensis]THV37748.1 hypothetical protein FAB82_20100 [Glycomyces buryatensis]
MMEQKIARLLELDAVAELERRWDEDDEFAENYNDSRLELGDPVELTENYPGGLASLYALAGGCRFGDVVFRREPSFSSSPPVGGDNGEPIDDRARIQIGRVGSESDTIFLDMASGSVMIYCYMYFKWGWDSGVILECADVPEFVDTVALGPRYREIYGPLSKTKDWLVEDPWYIYLQEIGMA